MRKTETMAKLSYPGERHLPAAERREREKERVLKSWAASQARVDRVWKGLTPEPDVKPAADNADKNKTKKPKMKILIIEPGDLPKVAERVRDILAASGHFFERGLPVR